MIIKHKLKMDLASPGLPQKVDAVQGDQFTRHLEISLYANGVPWLVPQGVTVVIRFSRADGSGGTYDQIEGHPAWSVAENRVTVNLVPVMLLKAGPVTAAVDLLKGQQKLTTFSFLVMVQPGVAFEEELLGSGKRVAAYLPIPDGAEVGQFLKVAQVNSSGVVTRLESANISQGSYPGYWENAVDRVVDKVTQYQDAGGRDSYSFCWFSDSHVAQHRTVPNPGHIGDLACAIMDRCGIPYAIMDGDAARSDGNALENEGQMRESLAAADEVFSPIGWERLLQVLGNHDGSWGYDGSLSDPYYCYQMDGKALYNAVFRRQTRDRKRIFGGDGTYYYVDDPEAKVRYVLLNSLWVRDEQEETGAAVHRRMRTFGFGQQQLTWLAERALHLEEPDWDIVIATHVPPLGDYRERMRDGEVFLGILSAFQAGAAYSGTGGAEGEWDYVAVSCDFTGAPRGEIVGLFCGHAHRDQLDLSGFPFPVLTITCDADLSYDDQEETRIMGTDNEHAMDVVTVNRQTHTVNLTRLGVGRDRMFLYGEAMGAMVMVTLVLNGCHSSNPSAFVHAGQSYTAQLTAEAGCVLDAVTVTMGGLDITAQAYADGNIFIETVTGELVITASAVGVSGGSNLADPDNIDWAANSRLNSSGQIVSCDGSSVTNWIECRIGDVIRISGLNILDATSGYLMVERTDTGLETTKCVSYASHFTLEDGVIAYQVHSIVGSIGPYWGGRIRFSGALTVDDDSQVAITRALSGGDTGDNTGGNTGGESGGGTLEGTNVADPASSDWANDSRLNSSAAVVSCPGSCVTNWIECQLGDVIQIAGLDVLNGTSGYLVVERTDMGAEASKCASYTSHFTVADGIISYTVHSIVSSIGDNWGGRLRFSGALTAGDAAGVKITVTGQTQPDTGGEEEGGETPDTGGSEPSGSYTNLADPASSDWAGDSRLNSAAAVVDCAGSCVTNWISCQSGDVLRVKGLDILDGTSGYLCYYRTDTNALESAKLSSYTDHFTVDNGVISYTVFTISQSVTEIWDGRLRLSGALNGGGAGAVVITVNEEI